MEPRTLTPWKEFEVEQVREKWQSFFAVTNEWFARVVGTETCARKTLTMAATASSLTFDLLAHWKHLQETSKRKMSEPECNTAVQDTVAFADVVQSPAPRKEWTLEAACCDMGQTEANTVVQTGKAAQNGLIQTLHHAFNKHMPLILTPDDIFLPLAQAAARHINANAEELRDRFVSHEGKVDLVIERDDFRLGATHTHTHT